MSEAPKPRTVADVTQEYNNLAFKAGNLQYQIYEEKRQLDMINSTLQSLNVEFASLKTKEGEVAKAVAAAKAELATSAEAVKEPDASPETAPESAKPKRGRPKKEAAPAEGASS